MEFFRIRRVIPFMRYAWIFNLISVAVFLIAVGSLAMRGLHLGVDFTGGTVLEVSYKKHPDLDRIRTQMVKIGFSDPSVQNFGSALDVLIRLPLKEGLSSAGISEVVMKELKQIDSEVELRRVEFVGPQVGKELLENGALALLFVSVGTIIYLWFRFEWKFGVSAIIANLHDVVIILGFFSIFQWEFTLPVLAAVLAVLGYSVNESVVIMDRVRECFHSRNLRKLSVSEIIDTAITATMSRTIITHASTQLMVCSMLFFGGEALFHFALALTIGIWFGIYSSIMVGSSLLLWLGLQRADLAKPEVVRQAGDDGAVV